MAGREKPYGVGVIPSTNFEERGERLDALEGGLW